MLTWKNHTFSLLSKHKSTAPKLKDLTCVFPGHDFTVGYLAPQRTTSSFVVWFHHHHHETLGVNLQFNKTIVCCPGPSGDAHRDTPTHQTLMFRSMSVAATMLISKQTPSKDPMVKGLHCSPLETRELWECSSFRGLHPGGILVFSAHGKPGRILGVKWRCIRWLLSTEQQQHIVSRMYCAPISCQSAATERAGGRGHGNINAVKVHHRFPTRGNVRQRLMLLLGSY